MDRSNPFADNKNFIDAIRTSFELVRDVERDPATKPIIVAFSVGNGRGASRPVMTDNEFHEFVGFINGSVMYDISSLLKGDSPAKNAAKTISADEEHISFKTSSELGARTVKVPVESWNDFIAFLDKAVESMENNRAVFWP